MRKENWTYKKLDEVCEINYGTRVVQKNDKGSTYFVYGGGGPTFMVDRYNREDCFIVARFAMSAQCTRFVKGKFFLNDSGLSVSTKSSDLSQAFVDKALLANNDVIYSMGKGMAQRNLDMPSFRNLLIPVPPLSTQSRIVSELDLLQSIIDKQKAQLKELDNLAQAIFYDMFGDPVENEKGWEVKKMEEAAPSVEYKGKHPQIANKYWLLNLDKVEAQTGRILSIDYYDYEEIGNSVVSFDKTNVLYSKLRPYLNKVVVPMQVGYATSELVPLQPNASLLDRQYIAYMLRSKLFVDYISGKVAGAKMPRVSMNVFREFKVPIPPLSLQQSFAQKVEAIERQKELINQSIREAQTLFDSRMEYYFG